MNKYQKAIDSIKQGRTWGETAEMMAAASGIPINTGSIWDAWNGENVTADIEAALIDMGLIIPRKKRIRLAADFTDEEDRQDFVRFYGLANDGTTFSMWVRDQWQKDMLRRYLNGHL